MLNQEINEVINSPAHYVAGRTIEPIEIIENWGLCHHLACAVKYIARAGRKKSILKDLLKAEWYLERELYRCGSEFQCNEVHWTSTDGYLISMRLVLKEWDLSPNLEQVLIAIKAARKHSQREQELFKALKSLRQEIAAYEATYAN